MKPEYLTIKEFAEKAGVSQQSIYKRLNKKDNPLQPYVKEVENKKLIRASALAAVYSISFATGEEAAAELNQNEEPKKQIDPEEKSSQKVVEKDSTERLLDLLEQQLQEKDRQLLEKDKQINEKDKQINELQQRLAEVHTLLNQQQHLMAAEQQKGLPAAAEQQEVETKKKGLFSLFAFWK